MSNTIDTLIKISELDYNTLLSGGSIIKNEISYSYDPSALYLVQHDFTKFDGKTYDLLISYARNGLLPLVAGSNYPLSGRLYANDGVDISGSTNINGDVTIGGQKENGLWNFNVNSRSLSVSGSLNVRGRINTYGSTIDCGDIYSRKVSGTSADFENTTVTTLTGSGFYFNGSTNSINGSLTISSDLTALNKLSVSGGTTLSGLLTASDATFSGTVRTKSDLKTYSIYPFSTSDGEDYSDNKYTIGKKDKNYSTLHIKKIVHDDTSKGENILASWNNGVWSLGTDVSYNGMTIYHSGNLSPMTTSHAANNITSENITNWNAVHTWYTTASNGDTDTLINNWNDIVRFLENTSDETTLQGLLAAKLNKSGGTITGGLIINGATTLNTLSATSLSVTGSASFSNPINGDLLGNSITADRLKNARTISITGSVTGSGTFDGSGDLSIATSLNHNHNSDYLLKSGDNSTGNIGARGFYIHHNSDTIADSSIRGGIRYQSTLMSNCASPTDRGNGIYLSGSSTKLYSNIVLTSLAGIYLDCEKLYYNGNEIKSAATHDHSDYVTAIGTSGNTLTWSKGGIALTAITIPYATNSSNLAYKTKIESESALEEFTGSYILAALISAFDHQGNLPKNDGIIINVPWGGDYGKLFWIDDSGYDIYLRYYNQIKTSADGVEPITYGKSFKNWIALLNSSNTSIEGDGGSTWGSSITVKINGTSKTLTIPSNPNTDVSVRQSQSTTSDYRPIVLGYKNASTKNSTDLYTTCNGNEVYTTNKLTMLPSTGNLYSAGSIEAGSLSVTSTISSGGKLTVSNSSTKSGADIYGDIKINNAATIKYNSTTGALEIIC